MSEKINVLGIDIDGLSAKEAMKACMKYLESDPANVVEMLTADRLIQMKETSALRELFREFDLVIAGDKTILEVADIKENKYLRETENKTFLKMFIRYLHKRHKRAYLLVETEEEGQDFYGYLEHYYGGIQIVGLAKVSAENRADDMLVNAINGGEIDCVLSILSPPLQEEFIAKNKGLLNIRVWMGVGKDLLPIGKQRAVQDRLNQFVTRHIFKKEIEKRRKNEQLYAVK